MARSFLTGLLQGTDRALYGRVQDRQAAMEAEAERQRRQQELAMQLRLSLANQGIASPRGVSPGNLIDVLQRGVAGRLERERAQADEERRIRGEDRALDLAAQLGPYLREGESIEDLVGSGEVGQRVRSRYEEQKAAEKEEADRARKVEDANLARIEALTPTAEEVELRIRQLRAEVGRLEKGDERDVRLADLPRSVLEAGERAREESLALVYEKYAARQPEGGIGNFVRGAIGADQEEAPLPPLSQLGRSAAEQKAAVFEMIPPNQRAAAADEIANAAKTAMEEQRNLLLEFAGQDVPAPTSGKADSDTDEPLPDALDAAAQKVATAKGSDVEAERDRIRAALESGMSEDQILAQAEQKIIALQPRPEPIRQRSVNMPAEPVGLPRIVR